MNKLPELCVHENKRFLMTKDGEPFFWLADTAWELIHRLNSTEVETYFKARAAQGFNVIQTVILGELNGLTVPNANGHLPLQDADPNQPLEEYFAFVDEVLSKAAEHGLYVALLPTWGDKVLKAWGQGPEVFNEDNARSFGKYLAERYKDQSHLIWILGGDRAAEGDGREFQALWQAMAQGIDEGEASGIKKLKSYHPQGGSSSSMWLHNESWLDFNMLQSSHGKNINNWTMIQEDYQLSPSKPTMDSEICYEDIPVPPWDTWTEKQGYIREYDVRKAAYRSVFSGGCGVSYGHHFVWQMYDEGREAMYNAEELFTWKEALERPAAKQLNYLFRLMASRPFTRTVPDQSIIMNQDTSSEGYICALRDSENTFALVYTPKSKKVVVDLEWLEGTEAYLWIYCPRTGAVTPLGKHEHSKSYAVDLPDEEDDWVIVIDNYNAAYISPGGSTLNAFVFY